MFTKLSEYTVSKLARGVVVIRYPFNTNLTDDLYQKNVDYINSFRVSFIDTQKKFVELSLLQLDGNKNGMGLLNASVQKDIPEMVNEGIWWIQEPG